MSEVRHSLQDSAEDADVDRYLRAIEQGVGSPGLQLAALTDRFIAVAASFSSRRGIDYRTWLEVGVPTGVLRSAGLCPPAHTPQSVLVATPTPAARRCRRHTRRSPS
jgi:hypothetical protein